MEQTIDINSEEYDRLKLGEKKFQELVKTKKTIFSDLKKITTGDNVKLFDPQSDVEFLQDIANKCHNKLKDIKDKLKQTIPYELFNDEMKTLLQLQPINPSKSHPELPKQPQKEPEESVISREELIKVYKYTNNANTFIGSS